MARIRDNLREKFDSHESEAEGSNSKSSRIQIDQDVSIESQSWVWWELDLADRTDISGEVRLAYDVESFPDRSFDAVLMDADEYRRYEAGEEYRYYPNFSEFDTTESSANSYIESRNMIFLIHIYNLPVDISINLTVH